ncbi:MAG: YjbH domain-containing protein [Verrucomicrobia bacterium]|nr:YjbH domain-containing protein [Verrucomicrobiota bacterium]
MVNFLVNLIFILCWISAQAAPASPKPDGEEIFDPGEGMSLFRDLELVKQIDEEIGDRLPFSYNYSMMGGYFTMPSARMPSCGVAAAGAAIVKPYDIYGVNFQMFDRLEFALNYRLYKGLTEKNFGDEGFGDDAERIGNVKLGILTLKDGFPRLPEISIGVEDFIGTKRFNSRYVVATKQFLEWNLECTLGYGKGRLKGFFGGAAWSPFRHLDIPLLKDISFLAEYDAINYKKHPDEHPSGRKVNSRINGGISFVGWDTFQFSLSSVRGTEVAGSASLRYPIGSTSGFFPKVDDAIPYKAPVDTEALGVVRSERDFAQEIAYALSDQGLDLFSASLSYDDEGNKELFLKIVNNRYREERVVRERIQHVLAALTPSDVAKILVIVEADALPCQAYYYRNEDLQRWRAGAMSDFELETVSPMREAPAFPSEYDAARIFQRHKPIWTFTIRPRLLTFFGSTSGKFKYNVSAVASPEGYVFDQVYYKFQVSYAIKSSMQGLGGPDRANPSRELIVRTDSLKYFQTNSVSMEQAFLQRGWNLGGGWFYRLALGYFESAYGGAATEFLFYPVNSNWAIGAQFAAVLKRHYHGVKFRRTTLQLRGAEYVKVPFIGIQYFLDFYYDFKPLNMDLLLSAGQFLAKDKGVRVDVGRYFKSGMRFSLWCTFTNGHDRVNGHTYYDKGFAFVIPLDMFMKQSSRNYIGYAMAAWLRDVGARAETGKKLYWTLEEERYNY